MVLFKLYKTTGIISNRSRKLFIRLKLRDGNKNLIRNIKLFFYSVLYKLKFDYELLIDNKFIE